jgi:hypothetical protein
MASLTIYSDAIRVAVAAPPLEWWGAGIVQLGAAKQTISCDWIELPVWVCQRMTPPNDADRENVAATPQRVAFCVTHWMCVGIQSGRQLSPLQRGRSSVEFPTKGTAYARFSRSKCRASSTVAMGIVHVGLERRTCPLEMIGIPAA